MAWDEVAAECVHADRCGGGFQVFKAAETGRIIGVALAEIDHKARTIYVFQILVIVEGLVFSMLGYAAQTWPGYTISGKRWGVARQYPRLLNN